MNIIDIPKTLDEAISILKESNVKSIDKIISLSEDEFIGISHHLIGRNIRNDWGYGKMKLISVNGL